MKTTSVKIVQKALALRQEGYSYAAIGSQLGIAPTTVMNHFNRLNSNKRFKRKCALVECNQEFHTLDPRQTCCCRSHTKRHSNRKIKKICVNFTECALPECSVRVPRIGRYRKFCCKKHSALNLRRWGRKHKGQRSKYEFYFRLLGFGTPCQVCGEKYVVDEHHVHYSGNRSDKSSTTVYLCPTHHMAIHRGFAIIDDAGKFQWQTKTLTAALHKKQPKAIEQMARHWHRQEDYPNPLIL